MASLGRIHPLVIHFPIALVLIAALAELIATITGRLYWRTVGVANVRVGAAFGVIAATAGWFLPRVLGLDSSALLEWHRWLGTLAASVPGCGARRGARDARLTLWSAAPLATPVASVPAPTSARVPHSARSDACDHQARAARASWRARRNLSCMGFGRRAIGLASGIESSLAYVL